MTAAAPRLLVVTDADLLPTSRGAGRTLLNLLSGWPADAVRVITCVRGQPSTDTHGHGIVDVGWRLHGGLHERLLPLIGDMNAQAMALHPLDTSVLTKFRPDILLVVPSSPAALVLGARWAEAVRVPSVTWLMDDWVQQHGGRWITGSADATARQLLHKNAGWLVISDCLGDELARWMGIERPSLVVHNAVTIGDPPAALTAARSGTFRLRYAGSVWPMHADALLLIARAVAVRRAAGDDIEFVLNTDARGWELHEEVWRETGTIHDGLVAYESLRGVLGESDLLVVASSFEAQHARMTRSSVQTKITDYLAAGRAILNVGPAEGACAGFLQSRDIALHVDVPDVAAAADVLRLALARRASLKEIAERGWAVCVRDHEIGAVSARMTDFLAGLARQNA
ncbi:MAG: hypothetical protein O2973_03955 [Gemmatimonadetes bacterium]|nr:hypothetical protein [Gemmatimonadota bacterium]